MLLEIFSFVYICAKEKGVGFGLIVSTSSDKRLERFV